MPARLRLLLMASFLAVAAVCTRCAAADGDSAALVNWLDQVADGGIAEELGAPAPPDQNSGDESEAELADEEPVVDGEAIESWEDFESPWPDPYTLQGIYKIDPAALDPGQSPPYCRGCDRPGAEGFDTCGGCIRPTWFFDAESMVLSRDSAQRLNLTGTITPVVVGNQVVQVRQVFMSTRNLNFNFQPGMRLTLGRYLGTDYFQRVHSLEASYFGLFNYHAFSEVRSGDTTIVDPTTLLPIVTIGNFVSLFSNTIGGFSGADLQGAVYTSNLNNYELNYRVRRSLGRDSMMGNPDGSWQRRCTPGFTPSFLVGLRYLSIVENFAYHSQGIRTFFDASGQPISTSLATGDYLVHTTNSLLGIQIGGDLVQQYCHFNVGVRGKTGIYANWASQRSAVTTNDPLPAQVNVNRAFGDNGQHNAVLTEFGFMGTWHIRKNINLKAAYDFFWLTSIANAPLQITPWSITNPAPGSLRHSGTNFFMGPTAGVECAW